MKRRRLLPIAVFALGAALMGVVTIVSTPRTPAERVTLRIRHLQPVVRTTLKACYTAPSDRTLAEFRTAVLEMRRLISSADCPTPLRKAIESELVEAVSIASGIFGDQRPELRNLSPSLVGW